MKTAKLIRNMRNIYTGRPAPYYVTVNLTNKCNQRCLYCEIGQRLIKTKNSLLDMNDIKWLIGEMKQLRIATWNLGGGEPFLCKHIFEAIEYAYQFGIITEVTTNGMLIPALPQHKIELLRRCKASIYISIDSFLENKQEHIRGVKGALSAPLEGIEKLVAHQIPVGILTVISNLNYRELLEIAIRANDLGVRSVDYQPLICISNYPEVSAVPDKAIYTISLNQLKVVEDELGRIIKFERTHPIVTNAYVLRHWLPEYIKFLHSENKNEIFVEKIMKKFWCANLYNNIIINYYGDILPCNMISRGKSIKQRNHQNLLEMWNATCEPIRVMIEKARYPSACRDCVCFCDRNMLYSALRHPFKNRRMAWQLFAGRLKR